jgi:hypothetical protein
MVQTKQHPRLTGSEKLNLIGHIGGGGGGSKPFRTVNFASRFIIIIESMNFKIL